MIYRMSNYKRVQIFLMQLSWSILLFNKTRQIVCFFCFNKYKIVGKRWVKRTIIF